MSLLMLGAAAKSDPTDSLAAPYCRGVVIKFRSAPPNDPPVDQVASSSETASGACLCDVLFQQFRPVRQFGVGPFGRLAGVVVLMTFASHNFRARPSLSA